MFVTWGRGRSRVWYPGGRGRCHVVMVTWGPSMDRTTDRQTDTYENTYLLVNFI